VSRRASGLRAWLLQRISAVYIGLFILGLLAMLLIAPPHSFMDWREWLARPLVMVAFILFIVSVALHAWVGMRDVLIDYVHPLGWRVLALSLTAFYLLGSAIWALLALEKLL